MCGRAGPPGAGGRAASLCLTGSVVGDGGGVECRAVVGAVGFRRLVLLRVCCLRLWRAAPRVAAGSDAAVGGDSELDCRFDREPTARLDVSRVGLWSPCGVCAPRAPSAAVPRPGTCATGPRYRADGVCGVRAPRDPSNALPGAACTPVPPPPSALPAPATGPRGPICAEDSGLTETLTPGPRSLRSARSFQDLVEPLVRRGRARSLRLLGLPAPPAGPWPSGRGPWPSGRAFPLAGERVRGAGHGGSQVDHDLDSQAVARVDGLPLPGRGATCGAAVGRCAGPVAGSCGMSGEPRCPERAGTRMAKDPCAAGSGRWSSSRRLRCAPPYGPSSPTPGPARQGKPKTLNECQDWRYGIL